MVKFELFTPNFLETYTGPMKSQKSLFLLQRMEPIICMEREIGAERAMSYKFIFFKPSEDDRDPGYIASAGSNLKIKCTGVPGNSPEELIKKLRQIEVTEGVYHPIVGMDEANFFTSKKILNVLETLLSEDRNVIVGGLNTDFRGETFNYMGDILARSDHIEKLKAICQYPDCKKQATQTQRLTNGKPSHYSEPVLLIQNEENKSIGHTYEARCRQHHFVPGRPTYNGNGQH